MAEPPVPSNSNSLSRGWTSRNKISRNPKLILEPWAPKWINAVTFCPSMIIGASLDHPTRWATGSGFQNGVTEVVPHGPICQAALMLAGLCPGSGWECTAPTVGWVSLFQWGSEPHSLSSPWAGLKLTLG